MKRFIISILAILYISSSIGAPLHFHYCMGELAEWGLGHKESKTCETCGMEKSDEKANDCCKDEHKFIKNNSDQKVVESFFLMFGQTAVAILPAAHFELPSLPVSSITEENPVSNAPPRSSVIAVYLLNRTFLI